MSNEIKTLPVTYSLLKQERISSKKEIDQLFEQGLSFIAYPLRVVFMQMPRNEGEENVMILPNAPKRKFKRAVDRNRLRRLIREAYRLNKTELKSLLSSDYRDVRLLVAFLYLDNQLLPYKDVEDGVKKALKILSEKLKCEK